MDLLQLKQNLDQLSLEMSASTESDLTEELNRLVVAGGKKFRPGLLFLMGEVFGFKPDDLKTYARAVELTHLASLIHDDVIDESPTRRNQPTLNSIRNNTTSILAGDFVLATVMGELSAMNQNVILKDLTICIQDLADGEWLQYEAKQKDIVTLSDLDLISIKKTGSLIRWCCTTPARLANYPDLKSMALLGERIGLIFQMADDITDGLNLTGRPPFQDITNGQFNFVTLKLIELFPEVAGDVREFRRSPKDTLPWTTAQYNEAIKAVDQIINFEIDRVLAIFNDLCEQKKKSELKPIFELTIRKIQSNYSSFFENLSHG